MMLDCAEQAVGSVRQSLDVPQGVLRLSVSVEIQRALLEPHLADRAVIAVDDVEGFSPSMQDYLDYVRTPANGYVSTTLRPHKALEYTVKVA